jgi:hypothetical protein
MLAPAVAEARLTMTAPFCAPLAEDAAMVGVAGEVLVGPVLAPLPPPHPHNNAPDKIIPVSIAPPALMEFSGLSLVKFQTYIRNHQSIAGFLASNEREKQSRTDWKGRD